jgi:probable rRNA maturation factor
LTLSELQKALSPVLAVLRPFEMTADSCEISLVLCDDRFIRDLNRRYREIDAATDVLSFAQDEQPGPESTVLGDIVVSLETADRQAKAADWSLVNEVTLLATHGFLHLLGHEDETAEGAVRMQELTVAALKTCGFTMPDAAVHPFLKEISLPDAPSAAP